MKTFFFKRASLIALIPVLCASTCNERCDKLDKAATFADLAFRVAEPIVTNVISSSGTETKIEQFSYWTNFAKLVQESFCCENTQSTNPYKAKVNVYYKENNTDEWGTPVKSQDLDRAILNPCENSGSEGQFNLLKNGFYLIEYLVDYYNSTQERNEDNNAEDFTGKGPQRRFEDNAVFGNNRAFSILEVNTIDSNRSNLVSPSASCQIIGLK